MSWVGIVAALVIWAACIVLVCQLLATNRLDQDDASTAGSD